MLASKFLQLPGILRKGLLVPQAQSLFSGCDPVTEPLCLLLVCRQGRCLGLQPLLLPLDPAAELWEEEEDSNVGKERGAYGEGGNPFSSPHWMSGPTGGRTHKAPHFHSAHLMEAGLGKSDPGLDGAHSIGVAGAQDLLAQRADAVQLQLLALHTLLHLLSAVDKAIRASLWGQAPTPEREGES